jgi:hypothetical protein
MKGRVRKEGKQEKAREEAAGGFWFVGKAEAKVLPAGPGLLSAGGELGGCVSEI